MERVVNVLDREVRVTGDDGDAYVEQLPARIHEPALDMAQILLADDAVVLDVGASLGLLSIAFAFLAPRGRVVAIEASPPTYEHLVGNVARAGVANVETMNVAVDEVPGTLEFFASPWFSAGSFVKKATFGAALHQGSTPVPAEPIDAIVERLGLERLDFVKVDVEGHELPALRGASETLRRFEPDVVVEMNLFTITSLANTMPTDFLAEIRARFPYVYEYAPGEGCFGLEHDLDAYSSIRRQFRTGRPSDLLCRFTPLPEGDRSELARRAIAAATEPAATELVELRAEVEELRAQLQAREAALADAAAEARELAERNAALGAEAAELRASTSWRITAPLRQLRDLVRRDRHGPSA